MKDDRLYLIHIWECIQRIESYIGEDKAAFLASTMMQDAIIRNFEIIGEATKHLSPELKQLHPEIQWRGMSGFREVLIHGCKELCSSRLSRSLLLSSPFRE
jgi:uncharacterized protein with HEPN domain